MLIAMVASIPIIFFWMQWWLLLVVFVLSLTHRFTITLNAKTLLIRQTILGLPWRTISSPINEVIIGHHDFRNSHLISPRKDYYAPDVKNNLHINYLAPFDSENPSLYIDYRGKERLTSFIWLIKFYKP